MVRLEKFVIHTTKYNDFINITDRVVDLVGQSGIKDGMALVMTAHTTTGITANEALECLQSDMKDMMWRLVPEYGHYAHSRMLHSYGTTAGNPTGHLRAMLTGNHVVFPVSEGKIVRGMPRKSFSVNLTGPRAGRST